MIFQFNNYFNNLNYLNPFLYIGSLGVEFQLCLFTLLVFLLIKFFTNDLWKDFLETCNVFNLKTLTLIHRDTGHYTFGYSKKLA